MEILEYPATEGRRILKRQEPDSSATGQGRVAGHLELSNEISSFIEH
jgi:hypothetical protein